jgi:hypothetical protein
MASTYTPNINLEEPARGDQVGTWDVPVNSNMTLLDLTVGGIAQLTLNNSPVVLSPAQFQARQLTFNSTLTGNVPIIFPSSFNKNYVIRNATTGSSAFVITLTSTVAGNVSIACPPGDTFSVFINNGSFQFENLGRIGTYWDYAGSSVPAWVTTCSIPPFLDCDGSTFNPAIYPTLAAILGGTTLPDHRGRSRFTLNGGTSRLTSSGAGIDGNTRSAVGGTNGALLGSSQIPTITSFGFIAVTDTQMRNFPLSQGGWFPVVINEGSNLSGAYAPSGGVAYTNALTGNNSMTYTNSNQAYVRATAPGIVGGVTLIRAG